MSKEFWLPGERQATMSKSKVSGSGGRKGA